MATTTQSYTGNGSATTYSFTFPYLKTEDVKVSINGTVQATTEYTVSATSLTFNTAPLNTKAIKIYRETDVDSAKAVFAAGASIRARDLNNNAEQSLYFAQEVADPANPIAATGLNLDESAKVDGSVIYYSSSATKFKADATQTLTKIVDGGSF